MNFILQISSKCRQGGEGVKKYETFEDIISGSSLTWQAPRIRLKSAAAVPKFAVQLRGHNEERRCINTAIAQPTHCPRTRPAD